MRAPINHGAADPPEPLLTFATGCWLPFESSVKDESAEPLDDPDPVGVPPPPPPPVPPADELLESELPPLDELLDPELLELLELDVESSPGSTVSGPVKTGGWNFLVVVVFCDVGGCEAGVSGGACASDRKLRGTAALVCVVSTKTPIAANVSTPARTARRAEAR